MGVRFLQTSGLHIGRPLRCRGAGDGFEPALRRCGLSALDRVLTVAREQSVDFVLIAGPLFDRRYLSIDCIERVQSRLQESDQSVYVLGDSRGNPPREELLESLPATVRWFEHNSVTTIDHGTDLVSSVRLIACRHDGEWLRDAVRASTRDHPGPTVGVLQLGARLRAGAAGGLLASEGTAPVTYWAVGQDHPPAYLESIPAGTAGAVQPRRFTEHSVGGGYLVDLDRDSEPAVSFVPIGPVRTHRLTVDIGSDGSSETGSVQTMGGLVRTVQSSIHSLRRQPPTQVAGLPSGVSLVATDWTPAGLVVRVALTGHAPVATRLTPSRIEWLLERVTASVETGRPSVILDRIRDRTHRGDDSTSPVLTQLQSVVETLRTDERETLSDVVGDVWNDCPNGDRDPIRPDRCALTDEALDHLVDRALEQATDRLIDRGFDAD